MECEQPVVANGEADGPVSKGVTPRAAGRPSLELRGLSLLACARVRHGDRDVFVVSYTLRGPSSRALNKTMRRRLEWCVYTLMGLGIVSGWGIREWVAFWFCLTLITILNPVSWMSV